MSTDSLHTLLTYGILFGEEKVKVETVQALIDKYPDAVKERNENGQLPLHVAIGSGASIEVVQLLINEYPDALKEKDEDGNLPLHIAVENGASVEVIQLLIDEYPDALKEKNEDGFLPLLYAVGKGASVEVIQLLIKEYPGAAEEKNKGGELPLHVAVEKGLSVKVIQLLIKEYPGAAKEKSHYGVLPLLYAVADGAPFEVIQLLINEYPDAAKEKDYNGDLPLHLAVREVASIEVIQLLIDKYPDAVREKDHFGDLPLYIAVEKGASLKVIQLLIDKYPDAVKEKNEGGELPLHAAVKKGASIEVIQLLIKKYSGAAKEKNQYGYLPLHLAIEKGLSVKVIQLLIDEYPDAVKEKNDYGELPLHVAVSKGASFEVIQLLIKKHPDALEEKNYFGNLPLHAAVANGASADVIQLLINEYPDALEEKDKYGNLPLHVAVGLHVAVEKGLSVKVIQLLIDEYPDALKEKNKGGDLPLHVAVGKGSSVEVIQLFINKYPDAAKEKNKDGRLPLHVAVGNGASLGYIQLILSAHSQAAKEKIMDGRLPIEVYLDNEDAGDLVLALLTADMPVSIEDGMPVEHSGSWCTCVSSNTKSATAAVRHILSNDEGGGGYGKFIHALADVRDAEDRTALDTASAGARLEIHEHLLFCGRYKLHIGPPEHCTATSTLFRAQDLDDAAQVDYRAKFDSWDTDGDGKLDREELAKSAGDIGLSPDLFLKGSRSISKHEFVAICKRQLGDGPPEVAIKLMRNEDHWERERDARKNRDLDPKYVVSELTKIPSQITIEKAIEKGDGGLNAIVENFLGGVYPGKYAFFMNAGDRNLQQIFYQEQPKLEVVRDMLKQVFEAVEHLHEKKLMHGDIKMLNILRFRIDNRLRLIDLDASARIEQMGVEDNKKTFTGAKFSSAILPPEMIERIETEKLEKFKKYWEAEKDEDLSEKVKPKPYKERGVVKAHYVVKSFRTTRTEDGKSIMPVYEGLPYDLVRASESIDAWSLGVLAFTLLTGETLIASTRDDDCASGAAMHLLYSWGTQPDVLGELFKKIQDGAARDLVRQLLQYDPAERQSIASILKDHPFFNTHSGVVSESLEEIKISLKDAAKNRKDDRALLEKMDANIVLIKQLSIENQSEIVHTRKVFLKGIYEATEINMPTTFAVLKEILPSAESIEKAKKQILAIVAEEDGSGVSLEAENVSLTFCAEGDIDIAFEGELKEHYEKVKTGMEWAKRIKELGSKVAAGEVGEAFDVIKEGIKELTVGDKMYLYLIDELTGEPVQAAGWPLEITKPTELVPKLIPLMHLGLRGLSIVNGVAGVASAFGFPVPRVPKAATKGFQESVELLKKESSVEEFGVVHDEVKGGGEEQKSVRGASLRVFMDFLDKHDPGLKEGKRGDFAGLQRIGDPDDGTALWTALTDRDEIEKTLQERAKQRKLEQLKRNEYIKKEARESEQRQKEAEQLNQNMHNNDTAKKEVESEGGEGNEVEVEISKGKVTVDQMNGPIESKNSSVNSEEIAEIIKAAVTSVSETIEATSPSTAINFCNCSCTIM